MVHGSKRQMPFRPAIIDYGVGNLLSVQRAFERIGVPAAICADPGAVMEADALVLPGVGAFRDATKKLHESGMGQQIHAFVSSQRPLLGICLGMQLLARCSQENGYHKGLGLIDAEVVALESTEVDFRIPHMGWNDVTPRPESELFSGIPSGSDFYFVHSYQMRCANRDDIEATCTYGKEFCCAVRKSNVMGLQFHPEKSQKFGRIVLENFVRLAGSPA